MDRKRWNCWFGSLRNVTQSRGWTRSNCLCWRTWPWHDRPEGSAATLPAATAAPADQLPNGKTRRCHFANRHPTRGKVGLWPEIDLAGFVRAPFRPGKVAAAAAKPRNNWRCQNDNVLSPYPGLSDRHPLRALAQPAHRPVFDGKSVRRKPPEKREAQRIDIATRIVHARPWPVYIAPEVARREKSVRSSQQRHPKPLPHLR